ncbi:MAG: hypothetical protein GX879_04035 [Bacteroidales bacterium]|nr:hypothetical protein [Bacteroidales bacterium]
MKSLKLALILILASLFISCNGNNNEKKSEKPITDEIYEVTELDKKIKYEKTNSDTIIQTSVEMIADTWTNGNKRKVFYFTDDSFQELVYEIQYYENGKKKMEGGLKNGERAGKWTAWYENDSVWSVGYYIDGKKHGQSAVFYANGNKAYDKNFVDDKAHGKWKFYTEDGKLSGEVEYENGEKISEINY